MAEKKKAPVVGMNADRAGWAKRALEAFCEETGQTLEADGFTEVASDLIADLMHLADAEGVRFKTLLDKAGDHYDHETQCVCKKCGARFDAEADAVDSVDVCVECKG